MYSKSFICKTSPFQPCTSMKTPLMYMLWTKVESQFIGVLSKRKNIFHFRLRSGVDERVYQSETGVWFLPRVPEESRDCCEAFEHVSQEHLHHKNINTYNIFPRVLIYDKTFLQLAPLLVIHTFPTVDSVRPPTPFSPHRLIGCLLR